MRKFDKVMYKIIQLRSIGKLKNLFEYYRQNNDGLTTAEIAAIYNRAITLDSQNRSGNLDQDIKKFAIHVEELVKKISNSIDKIPVAHLKYLLHSASKLQIQSWVEGTGEMILKLLEMVSSNKSLLY